MLGKNQASIFILVLLGYSLYSKKAKSHFKLTYIKAHFAQISFDHPFFNLAKK